MYVSNLQILYGVNVSEDRSKAEKGRVKYCETEVGSRSACIRQPGSLSLIERRDNIVALELYLI